MAAAGWLSAHGHTHARTHACTRGWLVTVDACLLSVQVDCAVVEIPKTVVEDDNADDNRATTDDDDDDDAEQRHTDEDTDEDDELTVESEE